MRGRFVLAFGALATLASANAVMGYALEQYDVRAWLAYVVFTVAFEAWSIGRWAGFAWPAAVGVSVLANLVTAGCCANLCGVGLHGSFVGTRLNPNPLLNMVVMFSVFALLSGLIEGVIWRAFRRDRRGPLYARSLLAHLTWVPLGLAIMLVPARPYPFLEGYTVYARRLYAMRLTGQLQDRINESGRVPNYRDTVRFFRETAPEFGPPDPDAWVVAYQPVFGRFATGQSRGDLLWEWNPAASGLKIDSAKIPERIWLLRTKADSPWRFGLAWQEGGVHFTNDRASLGYDAGSPRG